MFEKKEFLEKLKKRGSESHVYRNYQLVGLEIAKTLQDEKHKALYMKLAKERDSGELMRIAKDIASRHHIQNKGAYFMKIISMPKDEK